MVHVSVYELYAHAKTFVVGRSIGLLSLSLSPAHTLIHIQTRALSLSLTHTQTEITDKKLIHLVLLSALDIASHYFMNIVQNFPVMSMPFY